MMVAAIAHNLCLFELARLYALCDCLNYRRVILALLLSPGDSDHVDILLDAPDAFGQRLVTQQSKLRWDREDLLFLTVKSKRS